MPIAIFVFWAFISRPAQKRKKEREALERKRYREQQELNQEAESQAPESTPSSDPDWREEPDFETQPYDEPHSEKEISRSGSQSPEGRKPQPTKNPAPAPESAYTQHDSPITSATAYALGPSLAAQSSREHERLNDLGYFTASELQRLIVWSEVLGKPNALRDEH